MPSFSELKAKAASAASSGAERLQNMKDRSTSVPMKKTNWDPYSGQAPPPPPPPRSLVNQKTKPVETFLPPPSRGPSSSSAATQGTSASPGPPPLPARGASSTPPELPQRTNSRDAGPPLPSRTASSIARNSAVARPAGPPPPVVRSTRPDLVSPESFHSSKEGDSNRIDWTNLSHEDKEAFFSWLDEFFSKHLNITIAPRTAGTRRSVPSSDTGGGLSAPPPLKLTTKPTSWGHTTTGNSDPNFITSYPPPTKGESAAADLAEFFRPTTRWDNPPWYHSASGLPPPLDGKPERYVSSWQSRGSMKTTRIGVLFSDLSVFWSAVTYSLTNPENERDVKRQAWYLPRPNSLDQATLVEAHETYGDTIALFAESFLGSGQYCARGECWDLANEALKYFDQYGYIPKPVPSISRTHGHLIYEGKASKKGKEMVGRWRGGDDCIRRGDIIEWRKARIASVDSPGSYTILGDPEHTAVIVSNSNVLPNVGDGFSIPPSALGSLTVVEQSVGQPPVRKDYNLQGLEEGEMWIYRPIGLELYLGISDLTPTPPESLPRIQQV